MLKTFSHPFLASESLKKPKLPTRMYSDDIYHDPNHDDYYNFPASVYVQIEPDVINHQQAFLLSHWMNYNYILTFNDIILAKCPNARKILFGTTSISNDQAKSVNIHDKKFQMSSITGGKKASICGYGNGATGYTLRTNIYNSQDNVKHIPSVFYSSSHIPPHNPKPDNPVLGNDKFELFEKYQFSLAIENSRQINYFTEKLCDCLYTKTIPIYYGCPNIQEYFDTTGWIILDSESVDDFINKISQLDENYYMNHIEIVEKNYIEVQKYLDLIENVNKGLEHCENY